VDLSALLDELRLQLSACRAAPVAVDLFGSMARGEARADSDVDLGVLGGCDAHGVPDPAVSAAADAVSRRYGRPVDVVALDHAPVDLVARVLRDGILVLESDRERRIEFEVAARNAYFDLLPMLRRYRRRAIRSA
jgi:predicted nucleotidyltransferase